MHLDKTIKINTKTRCIAQTENSRKLLDNKLILSRIQQHFLRQAKNFTEQINYPHLLQEVQNALDNIKKELEVLINATSNGANSNSNSSPTQMRQNLNSKIEIA